ncbi:hypothetical protein ASG88_17625 [Nocardioides sp. Soil777]|uniref:TetR/AcrR family transcriptional regulator n=1 Tax=Nocardioides sp. Soil777 TaxID=1736409 RepID=UPI0007025210|nr:TetR/AcrR family transcriptional regulator [Nocardioides sp. Soil777]KRE98001.1 hypothetical protein ASG88_17625 [Nocardioides sp. Soil777]
MTINGGRDSVTSAVDRALAKQRADATQEVEAILDAALRVAERSAPAAPRVADIVAEAKSSNQAFYRYFNGKDDLMLAVMERGLLRVQTYVAHLMEKESDPLEKVAAWIRGILTQVTDETAARQSVAVSMQLGWRSRHTLGEPLVSELGSLLIEPIRQAGSETAELDAQVIDEAVMGTMNRHMRHGTAPDADACDHLVSFCLRGLALGRR